MKCGGGDDESWMMMMMTVVVVMSLTAIHLQARIHITSIYASLRMSGQGSMADLCRLRVLKAFLLTESQHAHMQISIHKCIEYSGTKYREHAFV